MGGYATLNVFATMVGPSGSGKGAAERTAEQLLKLVGTIDVASAGPGSGEGLSHLFAKRVKVDGRDVVEQHTLSVYLSAPEIDTLAALAARKGQTLMSELRKYWSGERTGFGYADPQKNLPLPGHAARLVLVVGMQPGRSVALFNDADGGTPQRFTHFSTVDPARPEVPPPVPSERLTWSMPKDLRPWTNRSDGKVVITVCEEVLRAVDDQAKARLSGTQDSDEGHAVLNRLKWAALLALLEGRLDVRSDDWALSGRIMAVSDRMAESCRAALADQFRKTNRDRAEAEGERAVVVQERTTEAAVQRVSRGIRRYLTSRPGEGWATRKEIRGRFSGDDRKCVSPALDHLRGAGSIEIEEVPGQGRPMVRYRWAER